MQWTTDELLSDIRDQARIADDDPEATNAILLVEATRQLHLRFVPVVRSVRSEYYTISQDQVLVSGQQDYPIPHRSTTGTVRAVVLVDTTGREIKLTPVPFEDRFDYSSTRGVPYHYTISDDRIVLLPTPQSISQFTLRVWFEYRPSELVTITDTRVMPITHAIAAGGTATASSASTYTVPAGSVALGGSAANWANFAPLLNNSATPVDVVRARAPFSCEMMDTPATLIGGFIVVGGAGAGDLPVSFPSGSKLPSAGDWLCMPGLSPIPQLPPEFHPLLAMATASKWLRPIDAQTSQLLFGEYQTNLAELVKTLAPRQQGTQMKIKSRTSQFRRAGSRRGSTFGDWR